MNTQILLLYLLLLVSFILPTGSDDNQQSTLGQLQSEMENDQSNENSSQYINANNNKDSTNVPSTSNCAPRSIRKRKRILFADSGTFIRLL